MNYPHRSTPAVPASRQAGFTIIELMIATLVFSFILIVITVGVMAFTNSYYKGVNSSTTQTATQGIIDDITQAIQFGGAGTVGLGSLPSAGTDGVFCAGSKLFIFSSGVEYNPSAPGAPSDGNWGLYMMNNPNTASCTKPGAPSGGSELLGSHMRLADFSLVQQDVSSPTSPWKVNIRVAYGDADLLCSTSLNGNPGGCNPGSANFPANKNFIDGQMQCRNQTGSQFCSVAVISAVAQQRLVN
jgi:type II secretory pathway pseudopilin PulG